MKRGFEALDEMEAEIRCMRIAAQSDDSDMPASLVLANGAKRLKEMSEIMVKAARLLGFSLQIEVWEIIVRHLLKDALALGGSRNSRVKAFLLPLRLLQRNARDAVTNVMVDVVRSALPLVDTLPRDNVASLASLLPRLHWSIPFLLPREKSRRNERALRTCIPGGHGRFDGIRDPRRAFVFGKRFDSLIRPLVKSPSEVYGTGRWEADRETRFKVSELAFGFHRETTEVLFKLRFAPKVFPWHKAWYERAVEIVKARMKSVKDANGRFLNRAGEIFCRRDARLPSRFFRARYTDRVIKDASPNIKLVREIDMGKFEAYIVRCVEIVRTMDWYIAGKDCVTRQQAVEAKAEFDADYMHGIPGFFKNYQMPMDSCVYANKFRPVRAQVPEPKIKSHA